MLRENRVGAAVPQTLVTTKLRAPRTRPNLVERPRLHEALARAEDRKLTLVSAPAGFGKTTLLVEWLMERSREERSVVWISLDESDNDPARFLSYLVGALQNLEEGIREGVLASLRSPELPPIEPVVGALINELAGAEREVTVFLDDYHLIDTRCVLHGLRVQRGPSEPSAKGTSDGPSTAYTHSLVHLEEAL
jgi:LuxR family maltose regulon positive regulatory protein